MERNEGPANSKVIPSEFLTEEKMLTLAKMVLAKLYFYLRRVKLYILSYIITKNSKWIKNLYLKSKTLKFFLEENTCSILQNIGVGKTRELTSGISRWDYIKKTFRVHRQPTGWEKSSSATLQTRH